MQTYFKHPWCYTDQPPRSVAVSTREVKHSDLDLEPKHSSELLDF